MVVVEADPDVRDDLLSNSIRGGRASLRVRRRVDDDT